MVRGTRKLNRTIKLPTLMKIQEISGSESASFQFLDSKGVFDFNKNCSKCGNGKMRLKPKKTSKYNSICSKCRYERSLTKGTFFQNSKIPLNKILLFGYTWLTKCNWSQIQTLVGVSEEVATNYLGFYRQLVSLDLDEDDTVIGGPGIVVEIDESKFGKRKYNRGHRVEGFWVFGGVERTEQRKFFCVRVPDRTALTLTDLIIKHIAPGSIIHSDCWKAYGEIPNLVVEGSDEAAYRHHKVNHSKEFVTEEGVHTNTIEGMWWGIKRNAPKKCDNISTDELLLEHVWRRKHHECLWEQLIEAFKRVHY